MNLSRFALHHRAIVLAAIGVLLLFGAATFTTMSRRENPKIIIRTCVVQSQWAGATPDKMEDLVTDPLEAAIQQIAEVEEIRSESRLGQSLIFIDMDERLTDMDQLFDEVRNKVDEVRGRLPDGVRTVVNGGFGDVYDVVLALHQVPAPGRDAIERPYSYRELEVIADVIEDDLKAIESVAKVDTWGVQDEVIHVEIDTAEWAKIDKTADDLRDLLESRNIVASGGEIHTPGARFAIKPTGEFVSVGQIGGTMIGLQDGALPVFLDDLPVTVTRDYVDPFRVKCRFLTPSLSAERVILLGVSMKDGRNVVAMGDDVKAHLRQLKGSVLPPDVEVAPVNDLPEAVSVLVSDFVNNLFQAMVIVIAVAALMMGVRAAAIMATAIPLSMVTSMALVTFFDVELEQFSIASLIIAMGMVVDNAIVVSDNIAEELGKRGEKDRLGACVDGAWSLAIPILTSTLTTVAAFGGMLTIVGSVGEFTRSLPLVVATTLSISFVVAMMVTPILCYWLLKVPARSGGAGEASGGRLGLAYERLVRMCLRNKAITLGAAAAAVVGALSLVPAIGNEFFPAGERDQFYVHVWLPEGASVKATDAVCREVEDIIRELSPAVIDGEERERLRDATSIVGSGGPRLTLTINAQQQYPNYALILVNTTDGRLSRGYAAAVQERVAQIPEARIDVRTYELGPYVERPVEFKLIGDDHDVLRAKAAEMIQLLRETPGVKNPTSDWGFSSYQVRIEVDDERANLAGVTNLSLANTMDTLISGGYLTTYREGDHQVKVLLRVKKEHRERLIEGLSGIYVNGRAGKVPLGSIARVVTSWQPSVIARLNARRCVRVGGLNVPGYLPNEVMARARPRIVDALADLPATYRLVDGGSQAETAEAQGKLAKAFLLSFFMIVLVLIAQYNSFSMPIVVLCSIPLALIGALSGLFLTGWALGFMPSLGVIALAGVVINNAIILIDFIEENRRRGVGLHDAIASAGGARMRPILLSTLTTVGGLLPLGLFGGPMWAGLAWSMVFGLLVSTVLTLAVTPTIYAFFVDVLGLRRIEVEIEVGAGDGDGDGSDGSGPTSWSRTETVKIPAAKKEPPADRAPADGEEG